AYPCKRILINLAPGDVRKKGSSLDLAMAVAIVAAAEALDEAPLRDALLYGELALDGSVRPVPGALAAALAARARGLAAILVARDTGAEEAAIEGLAVLQAGSLLEVVRHLKGETRLERSGPPPAGEAPVPSRPGARLDLRDVRGQAAARRALEIAAAGGHNLL